jgi:hypothetical protein
MDITSKTCDIRTWKDIGFLTYPPPALIRVHLPHCFTSASEPATQKSFDCCLSYFRISVSISSSSAKHVSLSCKPLYATNTSNRKQETFLYEHPLRRVIWPIKTHNRQLLFGSIPFYHGLHFDYWIQPLNMRTSVCYLDCHDAGLYCYLVIHIQNLLCPLQLFHVLPFVTSLLTFPFRKSISLSKEKRFKYCESYQFLQTFVKNWISSFATTDITLCLSSASGHAGG